MLLRFDVRVCLGWMLLLHAVAIAGNPAVEILKPLHESVVRRQSVEIEVSVQSMHLPAEGFGRLSIDGAHFSDIVQPHVSFIVADERVMGEGVHTLQVSLFRADGHPLGVSTTSTFQFARNFQPSEFHETEVFVHSPTEGQLIAHNVDLQARFSVTNLKHDDSTVVVTIDGDIVSENAASPAPGSSQLLLTAPLSSLDEGQHLFEVSVYSSAGDIVCDCRVLFELASWLPDRSSLAQNSESENLGLGNVAFGILVSAGPKTLARTLTSYKQAGLLDKIGQLMVFVQEREPELWEIASHFTPDVYGFHGKIGKGNAWLYMATACRGGALALIEEDFVLVEPPLLAASFLAAASALLQPERVAGRSEEEVEVVRLRHRKRPGEPLWVERSYLGSGEVDNSHLLHYLHFANHLDRRFPAAIDKCRGGPAGVSEFYCAAPAHADYTNNPAMYRTQWLQEVLGEHLGRDNFNTMERRVAPWWVRQSFRVAQGGGLFEHDRVDGQRSGQAGSEVAREAEEEDVEGLLAGMAGEALGVASGFDGSIAMVVWGSVGGGMREAALATAAACREQQEQRLRVTVVAVGWSVERASGWRATIAEGGGVSIKEISVVGWEWDEETSDLVASVAEGVDVVHVWDGRDDQGGGPGPAWVARFIEAAESAGAGVVVSSASAEFWLRGGRVGADQGRESDAGAEAGEEMEVIARQLAAVVCVHAAGAGNCGSAVRGAGDEPGMEGAVVLCCNPGSYWQVFEEVAMTRQPSRTRSNGV